MRRRVEGNGLTVQAIAGTHAVFLGFDLDDAARVGCLGFAIHREDHTEGEQYWLSGFKTFASVVPNPDPATMYSSLDYPVQSFYWGDYTAKPAHDYTYRIVPRYGQPNDLQNQAGVEASLDVTTSDPAAGTHGIYFNRGVAASQAYSRKFGARPTDLPPDKQPEAFAWLSRGLDEALVAFIAQADSAGFALRAAVYQFSQPDVLGAFRAASEAGADVRIVYHATGAEGAQDDTAIDAAGIRELMTPRTHAPIAHNKFVVLCTKDPDDTLQPVSVWTGSTNISEGGIFGHSNVGHAVRDAAVAARYLDYWTQVAADPQAATLRGWVDTQDPFTQDQVQAGPGVHVLFSPRSALGPLEWYAGRFGTEALTAITVPFGLATEFEQALVTDGDVLRFVLLNEKDSHQDVWAASPKVLVAVGTLGGPGSLDRWAQESLSGLNVHAVWIHTKILLIDPLSADPTVITGSANFSDASTTGNDENMLVIRGDTGVADVYFSEYSRMFQHMYARYWAATLNQPGSDGATVHSFLSETPDWQLPYFTAGNPKQLQRVAYTSGVGGNV